MAYGYIQAVICNPLAKGGTARVRISGATSDCAIFEPLTLEPKLQPLYVDGAGMVPEFVVERGYVYDLYFFDQLGAPVGDTLSVTVNDDVVGVQGPQGPQGERGDKGDKGDSIVGPSGADGIDGADGNDGNDGVSLLSIQLDEVTGQVIYKLSDDENNWLTAGQIANYNSGYVKINPMDTLGTLETKLEAGDDMSLDNTGTKLIFNNTAPETFKTQVLPASTLQAFIGDLVLAGSNMSITPDASLNKLIFSAGGIGGSGFNPRGEWDSGTTYEAGEGVWYYDSSVTPVINRYYVATEATSTNPYTDGTGWVIMFSIDQQGDMLVKLDATDVVSNYLLEKLHFIDGITYNRVNTAGGSYIEVKLDKYGDYVEKNPATQDVQEVNSPLAVIPTSIADPTKPSLHVRGYHLISDTGDTETDTVGVQIQATPTEAQINMSSYKNNISATSIRDVNVGVGNPNASDYTTITHDGKSATQSNTIVTQSSGFQVRNLRRVRDTASPYEHATETNTITNNSFGLQIAKNTEVDDGTDEVTINEYIEPNSYTKTLSMEDGAKVIDVSSALAQVKLKGFDLKLEDKGIIDNVGSQGTDGQVLTSSSGGVIWTDPSGGAGSDGKIKMELGDSAGYAPDKIVSGNTNLIQIQTVANGPNDKLLQVAATGKVLLSQGDTTPVFVGDALVPGDNITITKVGDSYVFATGSGTIGPQGYQGADGADGPQGVAGADGAQGPQGNDGADGATGPQGAIGETGPQGVNGIDGADGAIGPQGVAGADGADGSIGPQGNDGAQGPQGADGSDGAAGADGAQGPQGIQGADGGIQVADAPADGNTYGRKNNTWVEVGGGGGTASGELLELDVTQTSHGFTVPTAVYDNGSGWVAAQADNADTMATHVVIEVVDANTFKVSNSGRADIGAHGLTVGQYYFTSDNVAGGVTPIEPEDYSNPLFRVASATEIDLVPWRPTQSGGIVEGPQGPQGEVGAAGPQGAVGEVGATGAQGSQGDIGDTGATGAQGDQGTQGPQGDTGADSTVAGPQGATGFSAVQIVTALPATPDANVVYIVTG